MLIIIVEAGQESFALALLHHHDSLLIILHTENVSNLRHHHTIFLPSFLPQKHSVLASRE